MTTSTSRRIIGLPGGLTVTILRLPARLTASALRQMLASSLYVLTGATTSLGGIATGYGAYVGTSGALNARMARSGVSLHHWAVRTGRLQPDTVVLINRLGRPIEEHVRLLIEASIARKISRYTLLNIRTAAPTAATLATRDQRLWAMHTSTKLADLILGAVFYPHPPAAQGGTTREQLIRLILNQQPPRAMDVADLLAAAHTAGITIAGASPAQRSRRDVTTREAQGGTGRPRLSRTHIDHRAVIYPAAMTLREARADYRANHPRTQPTPPQPTAKTSPPRAQVQKPAPPASAPTGDPAITPAGVPGTRGELSAQVTK